MLSARRLGLLLLAFALVGVPPGVLAADKRKAKAPQNGTRRLAQGPRPGAPAAGQADRPGAPTAGQAEILANLGAVYMKLGRFREAADAYRRAIAAGRDDWQTRQNLGFALFRLSDWAGAVEQFSVSLEQRRSARALIALGRAYEGLGKPGVALHYLRAALPLESELERSERKELYDALGYLYAGEAEYRRAAEAWTASQAIQADPVMALRVGRAQRLGGQPDQPRQTLETLDPATLPANLQAERLDELGRLYRAKGEFEKSTEALTRANAIEAAGHRYHLLGLNATDQGRHSEAVRYFEAAVAAEPDSTRHLVSLGYAYRAVGRFDDAARVLTAALERDPDYLSVYPDLAYLHMRRNDNAAAVEWFGRAIDNRALHAARTEEEAEKLQDQINTLRKDATRLTNYVDFTLYHSYRSDSDVASPAPGVFGSGAIASQGGAELAIQPPVIGFRDERVFQAYGRVLWNTKPESLEIDDESLQGGLGVRYKPFRALNLFVSGERLFKIGDNAIDDWLVRLLTSWDDGFELKTGERLWNFTYLYAEAGYFFDGSTFVLYGEARQGLTVNLRDRFLITPHVVGDARYEDPSRSPFGSFVEGGLGVSFKFLFNESEYEVHRSSVELIIQYKFGKFLRDTGSLEDDTFSGLLATGLLRF